MKRRTEKKQGTRYLEDRAWERRRERDSHMRWVVSAMMRDLVAWFAKAETEGRLEPGATDRLSRFRRSVLP